MKTINAAIEEHFAKSGYIVLREVADATGMHKSRAIDFIVLGIWPSRGFEVIGVEMKIARADWLRELNEPAKADAVARHCDSFYIAATAGVVHEHELPNYWGLILFNAAKGSTRCVKLAARIDKPGGLDRGFVMSLVRNAVNADEAKRKAANAQAVREAEAAGRRLAANENRWRAENAERELTDIQGRIREFEEASGLSINKWDAGKIGDAVRRLQSEHLTESRIRRSVGDVRRAVDQLTGNLRDLEAIVNDSTEAA